MVTREQDSLRQGTTSSGSFWNHDRGPQRRLNLKRDDEPPLSQMGCSLAYHLVGWEASLMLTCMTPVSRSPRALNAAIVKSTCRDPGSQPWQLSTTRTNTHLLGPLQTGSGCQYVGRDNELQILTFEEFKAGRFGEPAFQSQSASKRFVLRPSALGTISRWGIAHSRCPSWFGPTARVLQILACVPSNLDFLGGAESTEAIPGAIDGVYQGIS